MRKGFPIGPLAAALAVVASSGGGCFKDPGLSECGPEKPCPEQFPECEEGLCFHHTFHYLVPPCSTGAGESCCDLSGGRLDQDPDCGVREEQFAGSTISGPVGGMDGSFYFTRVEAGGALSLLKRDATGGWEEALSPGDVGREGTEGGESADVSGGAEGGDGGGGGEGGEGVGGDNVAPAPAVVWDTENVGDGFVVVAAGSTVHAVDFGGKPLAGWGDDGKLGSQGSVTGPVAACASGAVAWTTSEAVWRVLPGGKPGSLPLDVGTLPTGIGVVRHEASGWLVVPASDATRLVGVRPVGTTGLLELGWELKAEQLESPIQGLALDRKGYVYVLTSKGRLRALPVEEGPDANSAWKVDSASGIPLAGPVLRNPGEALLSLKKGGVYRAVEQSPFDVQPVRSGAVFFELAALRLGGFAGTVQGNDTLAFLVSSGDSLLDGGLEGEYRAVYWDGDCPSPAMSLPSSVGTVALTCGSDFRILAAPEHPGQDFDWPAARGWGNSGCL